MKMGYCAVMKSSNKTSILLSQRESLVTVKFFDPEISMIFDISELPESKHACVRACV